MDAAKTYERYKELHFGSETLGFELDVSRIRFPDDFLAQMAPRMAQAFEAMSALESGAIANADERRRVGHYWLRAPQLAPEPSLTEAILRTQERVVLLAQEVRAGTVHPERAPRFENLLVIGIGGSALGPRFVSEALGSMADPMRAFFFDNTDPDGMDRVLDAIGEGLDKTLTVVISKSGGTKETRNGMLEARAAYERRGLRFGAHALAVTGENSELDQYARAHGFVDRLPMWDWVGGRTSELSAVGLVPAALQGLDIAGLIEGARAMDELTRVAEVRTNPAAILALAWYAASGGAAKKAMVVLPYKDRLELFSRYLQQLVMESLGKRLDRDGREVHQGLVVYGNKGSTDQHAYVQQLRDGPDNMFVTFIEVLRDRDPARDPVWVDPGVLSGDYLSGFWQGTRAALSESGRQSITVTIDEVSARSVGALIALYERAVGLYGELVNVNAYHQPGVEAGKRAAERVLDLQAKVLVALRSAKGASLGVEAVAAAAGVTDLETVYFILRHLAANPHHGVARQLASGAPEFEATFASRA
jgi:glucose-6-phosphate isomerase